MNILIAEDSPQNVRLIQVYLQGTGYTLDIVGDGQQALEHFIHGRYDLVFMDIQMPVMDGYTATGRIRQWERAEGQPRTPIISLTAYDSPDEIQKSFDSGCDGHVTKPFRKATLLDMIATHTAKGAAHGLARSPTEITSELRSIVPQFLKAQHTHLAEVTTSLASGDFARIQSIGHDMKGTGAGYGFPEISKIGDIFEAAGRSKNEEIIRSQLVNLAEYLSQVNVVYI